jgi:hypothetical protein
MNFLFAAKGSQAFPDKDGKIDRDDLKAARGIVNGTILGVLLWTIIVCIFLLVKAHAC